MVRHLRTKHRITDLQFVCSKCNSYSADKAMSVGTHMRTCKGLQVDEKQFKCENCPRSFTTLSGKQVHRSRQHPAEYNDELPTKRVFAWTDPEIEHLVRITHSLKEEAMSERDINLTISEQYFLNRTVDSVRKMRGSLRFREMEAICSMVDAENMDRNVSIEDLDESRMEDEPQPISGKEMARQFIGNYLRTCERPEHQWGSQQSQLVYRYIDGQLEWDVIKPLLFPTPIQQKRQEKENNPGQRRMNRNARKRSRYAYTQKQWDKDRKATILKILKGELNPEEDPVEFPDLEAIEETYSGRLESVSLDTTPEVETTEVENGVTYGVITVEEIGKGLKSFKSDTASGVDRINLAKVLELDIEELKLILNAWWVNGIPESEKQAYSILLHKKGNRLDVGNYRPLTIGTILLRLYAKIWDRRVRAMVELSGRQKAFVPVDGSFQNVHILRTVIKNSRKSRRELNMVFLDLAKAFDTVTHDSIRKALIRKGVPTTVVEHIMSMYSGASTTFKTMQGDTRGISILSGVKQGCPLSPLLFNLILDELIERLESLDCGVSVRGNRFGVMAFADDLVLLSSSKGGMDLFLRTCKTFFEEKSLKVNAGKCGSMWLLPVKGKKSMKVVTEDHRYWGDQVIPNLTHTDLTKYLGIDITPKGDVLLPYATWKLWFQNLRKSALKVEQKVLAMQSIVIPKIFFTLRLSNAPITMLRKIDRLIRLHYKALLHLPPWTPNDWIHSRSGGGILCLTETVVKSRKKAVSNMLCDNDVVAVSAAAQVEDLANRNLRALDFHGEMSSFKKTMEERRMAKLGTGPNGTALVTMARSSEKRSWMGRTKNLPSGDKIHCIKILSGTMPTRVNLARGGRGDRRCRRCGKTAETDLHILSECAYNKDLIIRRHDRAYGIIAKALRKRFPDMVVLEERTWKSGQQQFRPDITVIHNNQMRFVEVTCPYEKNANVLADREAAKEQKYSKHLNAQTLHVPNVDSYQSVGLAFGCGGTIDRRTRLKLQQLGFPLKCMQQLQMSVMKGSVLIARRHFGVNHARPKR